MTINRVLVVLLSLVVLMQASILYRQHRQVAAPIPPSVWKAEDNTFVEIDGMPVEGNASATVVLIEFSDYECPFCRQHATTVRNELRERFVATGQLRYVFGNNPLAIHPGAEFKAIVAVCAWQQGHYWSIDNSLFRENVATEADVLTLAVELAGIDADQLLFCANEDGEAAERVARDRQTAVSLGLRGTPAFALGRADSDGRVRVEVFIRGAQPFEVFAIEIEKVLWIRCAVTMVHRVRRCEFVGHVGAVDPGIDYYENPNRS